MKTRVSAGSRNHPASLASSPSFDEDLDFDDEPDYYKDLLYPDDPTGELAFPWRLESLFNVAGYKVRRAEKASPYHPVWIVKLVRTTAERIEDDMELFENVKQLLNSIECQVRKPDLVVQRTGDKILVTFLWLQRAGA